MKNDIAIRVQNLSKCYQIYDRPQDRLKQSIVPRLQRAMGAQPKQYYREFWALRDVSFDIKRGETLGIIGRNGSGKSTLLQIVCGTLTPTSGSVELNGRVAALLELGSGFNPEFTGRENVYMNAKILGLSTPEIDDRFDDIAAFADIGDFIEQPVKTYSSGMYVRLAFAVIVHVDADILVIDEALAVGDVFFTQKCMRFLRAFMQRGTVIFVSHDTGAVTNLCQNAIWLNNGHVEQYADAKLVSEAYLTATLDDVYRANNTSFERGRKNNRLMESHAAEHGNESWSAEANDQLPRPLGGWKTGIAEISSVEIIDFDGRKSNVFSGGEEVSLRITATAQRDIVSPIIGFLIKDRLGQVVFGANTFNYVENRVAIGSDRGCKACFKFQMPLLANGDYAVAVAFAEGTAEQHIQHHWIHDALFFKIISKRPCDGLISIRFIEVTLECM